MPQFNKHTKSAALKALKPTNKIGNTQWAKSVRFIKFSLIRIWKTCIVGENIS